VGGGVGVEQGKATESLIISLLGFLVSSRLFRLASLLSVSLLFISFWWEREENIGGECGMRKLETRD
jgi:hypothetical protein